jgi:transcriptional regulator with XRE-family HTH domain
MIKRGRPGRCFSVDTSSRGNSHPTPLACVSLSRVSRQTPETNLRDFLRTRRSRITPEQAGLTTYPGVRRVPGLRREEVAQLAGVSVDYYVRLERGHGESVSASVLEAVARALQLNNTERDHLFALAKHADGRRSSTAPQHARPGLLRLLENVTHVPALLLGRRLDILATNRLARAFYPDFHAATSEPNLARYVFLTEAARNLYVDWPDTASDIVGMLHLEASHRPQDPLRADLVNELSAVDGDFRRLWADHDVYKPHHGSKRYHHPLVGDLELGFEAFTPVGDPDQILTLCTVEPGSPSETALRRLASLSAESSQSEAGAASIDEYRS